MEISVKITLWQGGMEIFMGNKIYRSNDYDKFMENERLKKEYMDMLNKRRRRAIAALSGIGVLALAVIIAIISLLAWLFSGDDTSKIEEDLKKSSAVSGTDIKAGKTVTQTADEAVNAPVVDSPALAVTQSSGLIVIDPGHGGYDSGCLSSKAYEKEVDLQIALKLQSKLKSEGYEVYLTRSDDVFVGINDRADLANEQPGALLMVGIHQNSSDNASDSGVEVWTCDKGDNGRLSEILADSVSASTGAANRGVQYRDNFVVCSKANMPSVVLECGFLSNSTEADLLISDDYQDKIAEGVVNGIEKYINNIE